MENRLKNFDISIAKTKFNFPESNNQRIIRQRLIDKLNAGLQGRLIHINAPAGYGKTTAVIDWLKCLDCKVIWFSVGEEDNNVKRFWKSIVYAFTEIIPDMIDKTNELFKLPNIDIKTDLIFLFIDEINKFENNIVFVFDDFHLIKNSSIHQSIHFLIKYLPNNFKLVFTSRTELPFPVGKYRANGQLTEIVTKDLCFTKDELKTLLGHAQISLNDIEELDKNEGWITGIQIMVMELKQGIRNIRHYLMEEILDYQDEETRKFLIGSSILNSFCAPLCDEVLGRCDSKEVINKLMKTNSFIFSLDQDEQWYRCHHLLLHVLRQNYGKDGEFYFKKLHKNAAVWYEKNNMIEEAIEHYFLAKEFNKAIMLIEKVVPLYMQKNDFAKILEWFKNIPDKMINESYIICLVYSRCFELEFQFEKAWDYIVKAEKIYEREKDKNDKDVCYLEAMKADIIQFKLVYGLIARDYKVFMTSNKELSQLNISNTVFAKYGHDFNLVQPTLIFLLFEDLSLFDNNELLYTINRLRNQKITNLNYLYVLFGEMLYESNIISEALPLIEAGSIGALEEKKYGAYFPGVNTLAKIYSSQGDRKKAVSVLLEGEEILKEHNNNLLAKKMKIFRMELLMNWNEMEQVNSWMQENQLNINEVITFQNMFELIVFTKVLIKKQEYLKAEILLFRLIDYAKERHLIRWSIITNLRMAIVYYHKRRVDKVLSYLNTSITLGFKHKYFRIFVDEGVVIQQLLSLYVDNQNVLFKQDCKEIFEYINKIIECIKSQNNCTNEPVIKLTRTEINVLRLIKEGFSNDEIAEELNIKIPTVKAHISSIFRKLDVNSRTKAVAKAIEGHIVL